MLDEFLFGEAYVSLYREYTYERGHQGVGRGHEHRHSQALLSYGTIIVLKRNYNSSVDRRDLIHLKLYAAADATGPSSVHYQDLVALNPTFEELQAAENWTRTQDPSPSFQTVLDQVVEHVKADTSSRRG